MIRIRTLAEHLSGKVDGPTWVGNLEQRLARARAKHGMAKRRLLLAESELIKAMGELKEAHTEVEKLVAELGQDPHESHLGAG